MNTNTPRISIIITTKNEEAVIRACLASIRSQTYKHVEIILIDNGSTDSTRTIAKEFTSKIYIKGPERSAQRNYGVKVSSGEHLLFLDADMELSKNVLQEYTDIVKNKKIVGCVIPEESFGVGFWAACKAFERSFYLGVSWIEAARFYKKNAFIALGGYDEKITGPEDFDLSQRLLAKYGKASIGRTSANIRHNEGELQLWVHLKKKMYYGRQMRRYVSKIQNAPYIINQVSLLSRFYLFLKNSPKLVEHPLLTFGMVLLKTFEMTALLFGYLYGVYNNKRC